MAKSAKKKLWFRRKTYGWGWHPCSWEGWLVTGGYLIFVIGLSSWVDKSGRGDITQVFYLPLVIATLVLIGICYATGESPRWQWGKK